MTSLNPPPTYASSLRDVLAAVSSPDGAPASGAACTVALSLAVECVALQVALTRRHNGGSPDVHRALTAIEEALPEWRSRLSTTFDAECAYVAALVERRRAGEGSAEVMDTPLDGERTLIELAAVAREVHAVADRLTSGLAVRHSRAEGLTAAALCDAVLVGVDAMQAANAQVGKNPGVDRAP